MASSVHATEGETAATAKVGAVQRERFAGLAHVYSNSQRPPEPIKI